MRETRHATASLTPPPPPEEANFEGDQHLDTSSSTQWESKPRRGDPSHCASAAQGDRPQASRGLDNPGHGNWWPLRGDSSKPVPALADCGDIILLSFFDGLGSTALAVQSLGIRIRACLEWEVDPCAIAVASRACKGLRMKRGDMTADDPEQVATILRDLLHEKSSIVLVTAGPPCPDYSKINASAQGREGSSGQLFVRFTEFLGKVEKAVGVQFHLLVENVLLQKSTDLEWFNQAMGAQPLAADAASFGLISRPRTWWTRVDWTKVQTNPYYPDRPLRWEKLEGLMKLQLDVEQDKAEDIQMPGLSFHSAIVQKRKLLPCLTTPAPSDEGRPPPKKMKGRMSAQVRQRWLSGNRQYAPWVYEDHALVYEAGGQGQIIPAELKEQLHHYPQGYTRHPQVTPRDRHRLLGNSWHVGVARFLIALVLISACGGTRTAAAQDIDSFMAQAKAREIPVAGHLQCSMKVGVKPAENMWEQWQHSMTVCHPLLATPMIEESVRKTMEAIMQEGPELPNKRKAVLRSLHSLKAEMQSETAAWFSSLPSHVASAYQYDGDKIVQIPMLIHLLRGCGYPDCDKLAEDLSAGFPLLGEISRSPGWHPRDDDRYQFPISQETFASLNGQYIRGKAAKQRPDPEWQTMLQEILKERKQGLIEGPFEAHPSWGFSAVGPDADSVLLPMEGEQAFGAFAFSVVQEGSDGKKKTRRCEDYRRSFHNSTVKAHDKPPHDTVDTYIRVIRAWALLHQDVHVWCQDMMSAYRQYPVRDTSHAYLLLQLPTGVSVWRHRVLPFGSSASVWHFNRCTDAVVWLARCLTSVLALHYVDDVGGPEPAWAADSSCSTFRELCDIIGIRVKPSKEQRPASLQKLLGVWIAVLADHLEVKPDPTRINKMTRALQQCLIEDRLSPEEASRLCGKLVFLQTSMFGMVGRAAMTTLYARSHGGSDQHLALNQGLRSAISTLISVMAQAQPRRIPLRPDKEDTSIFYADAFFKLGAHTIKVGQANSKQPWLRHQATQLANGWGFIAKAGRHFTAGHGEVPARLVERFSSRKAYIFFLEVNAQVLALLANRHFVDRFWICFIDNQAGKSALAKGFSGEASVNNLLAFFWCLCARLGWFGHFEWVASKLNPADPVSRGVTEEARSRGAVFLREVPEAYWQLLWAVADDMRYATAGAVEAALALDFVFQAVEAPAFRPMAACGL